MRGVIACGDQATAAAGAEMLRDGGNAVDAAVAAAFASFIAEIGVVHLGGSGVAQIYRPGPDSVSATYDFFSAMPGLGRQRNGEELDFERVTIDFGPTTQDFYLGRGSVAAPGNIFGLCRLAADYGRLPLARLLGPARRLARDGHPLAPFQADTCQLLEPLYTNTADMRRIFAPNGHVIRAGERLTIPNLERTLIALAEHGADYIRSGSLAQAIVADQRANGGLVTAADLATYEVHSLAPVRFAYHDFEILLPPPSSSGGVLTAFTLRLLSHFKLSRRPHGSPEYLRLLFEVMAATTRARPIWDRAAADLPVEEAIAYFLSERLLENFISEVRSALDGRQRFPALTEPNPHPDTSHLSVIDGQGLAVSLTTTAGESAGYVVPGTGFIPNNILGEEDLHPAGFHQGKAGERIHTMMTPAIVLHKGNIRLVVGSGGSIRIRSAILQVLTNLLDYGMSLDDAVNKARVHLENGVLQCEFGVEPEAIDALEESGYPVNRWDRRSIYFGGAHSVSRTPDGRLVAAGDSRRGGAVAVVE
ncbi:MAG: gamma-glutamyltransferase [Candidatus Promineifilaceae bacterium]|nr:gamma-glutamyltransferase [Candidatus Promineifilaceae bacterium]